MDRSFEKVKEIITSLSGVELLQTYKISRKGIYQISKAFPKCIVYAELTSMRLLDIMKNENVEYLVIDEEELDEIVRNISTCIQEQEVGGVANPGAIPIILGAIGGETAVDQNLQQDFPFLRNIGEFMGTESDRRKKLTPLQLLARSGRVDFLEEQYNKGELEGVAVYDVKQAALASQNYDAYLWVVVNLRTENREEYYPPGLYSSYFRQFDILPGEYDFIVASYYGSTEVVERLFQIIFIDDPDTYSVDSRANTLRHALAAATAGGRPDIIRFILQNMPDDMIDVFNWNYAGFGMEAHFFNSDLFKKYRAKGASDSAVDMIEAFYSAEDLIPQSVANPKFINAILSRRGTLTLDTERLYDLMIQKGVNSVFSQYILNVFFGTDGMSPRPYLMDYRLDDIRQILDLAHNVAGQEFVFDVEREDFDTIGDSDERSINREFDYPDGYFEYLTGRGMVISPIYM